jgi:hypothetical protein
MTAEQMIGDVKPGRFVAHARRLAPDRIAYWSSMGQGTSQRDVAS